MIRLRPQAPRDDGGGGMDLRTTHASWVYLTDGDVWKVKRPVDLGFLDFRTVEARRRACEDEVRLNRRLAPGIYLGVEPVRASPEGPVIGGSGAIVDWAVHMRRLPDQASAAALLQRGLLRPERLAGLAEKLAAFWVGARPRPDLGAPDLLRRNVDENFAQVAPFMGDLVERASFDDVRAFQLDVLASRGDRFNARVDEGRIRDGHGDLRLEHVYFLPPPDGIVVIDCIEFNDRFRCGDVAGEAAFLAMELEAARRPDLAAGFLARLAEASDDFGLYGVVDFYLSYRAWVRGKVAAFLAADPNSDVGLRAQKREEARRLFALARSFSGIPADAPFLIAVGGVVGGGKSTLAAALGQELAAPVVSSDRTRKALAGLAPTDQGDARLYTTEAIDRNYRAILGRAERVLASGRGVILDATFSARRWRDAATDLARATGARFAHLEATCADRAILRTRLAARRARPSVSDATDAQLEALLARREPFAPHELRARVAIDTSRDPAGSLRAAVRALEAMGVHTASTRQAS
ncbi:MAG TPA: AAA family ATPase [Polyangia bacterium]|nr:AAA family ATPase [Polyangia bacterium]